MIACRSVTLTVDTGPVVIGPWSLEDIQAIRDADADHAVELFAAHVESHPFAGRFPDDTDLDVVLDLMVRWAEAFVVQWRTRKARRAN